MYGYSVSGLYNNLGINHHFQNENYLATTISHLNIYSMALDCGYGRILVLEDDLRIHRSVNAFLKEYPNPAWDDSMLDGLGWDLLYLAHIPLTDDLQKWDYSITDSNIIKTFYRPNTGKYRVFSAKNLWSLMAYGINSNLMNYIIQEYEFSFKKELDRYFVNNIQNTSKWRTFGVSPQLFASENGVSSNSGEDYKDLFRKSVDTRYADLHDYV